MRPARALIDLSALRHNHRVARELAGGKVLAVVKANAYGHGAVRCARALEGETDGFGVACIEEALELREAGIRAPILLLEGFFEADELALIDAHDLWCVVHSPWQIDAIERARPARPFTVWLKLDSGMHRLGLAASAYRACLQRLQAMAHVRVAVAMTHFACADALDNGRTPEQLAIFQATCHGLGLPCSLGNSPALLGWPEARGDWARPGLMLYGATPFAVPHPAADRLKPVMTVTSTVIATRELAAGEPIGYGARFIAPRPSRIGVVALGYADGYPQFAPNGTPVAIDGQPGALVGRVSMDMLTVDLTDHPDAGIGSTVELWGHHVRAGDLAPRAATSAYRLFCGVLRIPRHYIGE